jgi:hypothetical protein
MGQGEVVAIETNQRLNLRRTRRTRRMRRPRARRKQRRKGRTMNETKERTLTCKRRRQHLTETTGAGVQTRVR